LTALPRLRPAVLPRNSTCERVNGTKGQRGSNSGVRFQDAGSPETARARSRARSERIGLFFGACFGARLRQSEPAAARRDRRDAARSTGVKETHLEGGGGSSESSHCSFLCGRWCGASARVTRASSRCGVANRRRASKTANSASQHGRGVGGVTGWILSSLPFFRSVFNLANSLENP
jgi:hypothetical protein